MAANSFKAMVDGIKKFARVTYKSQPASQKEVDAVAVFYEAAYTFAMEYSKVNSTEARILLGKIRQGTAQFLEQAKLWQDKGCQDLQALINIIAKCDPEKAITSAKLDKLAKLMGFASSSAIESSFTKAGFKVLKNADNAGSIKIEDYFYQDNKQELEKALDAVRENAKGAYQAYRDVSDIYAFIDVYKSMNPNISGTDYRAINEEASRVYSGSGDAFLKAAQNVCTIAAKILADEDSVRKYQNYLVMAKGGSDSLLSMLAQIKSFDEDIRNDASFVEPIIAYIRERIESVSRDEDFAIALYNKYTNSAYQRIESTISIACPKCGKIHKFHSLEEAGHCDCGAPLLKVCPRCGKSAAASSIQCWSCGFDFSAIGRFDEYKRKCERALQAQDLQGAEKYFDLAERANPNGEGLSALREDVQQMHKVLMEPINAIKSLLAAGKMYAARAAIQKLKVQRPGIDLRIYEEQVIREISIVENAYAKMEQNNEPGERKVELCLKMLNHASDFAKALSMVNAHRPPAPAQACLTTNQEHRSCVLSWKPLQGAYIYTVVRKVGSNPASVEDGEVIGRNLSVTSLSDTKIQPGKRYYYAVFSARADFPMSVSLPCPADNPALLFTELDERTIRASVEEDQCELVWKDVPGTAGVRVERSDDGTSWNVVADCVKNSFTDRHNLRTGITYRYRLSTVYLVDGASVWSRGVQKSVRLLSKPEPLTLQADCAQSGICTISWATRGEGAVWIYNLNDSRPVTAGDVIDVDDMDRLGTRIIQTTISEGSATYHLGENKTTMIAAFRPYGEKAVAGSPIALCTVPPLNVRARITPMGDSTSLHFQIIDLPSSVVRVYYHVSFGDDTTVLTQKMIESSTHPYVERLAYEQKNDVEIPNIPKEFIHLSVIAQYKQGGNVFYSPTAAVNLSNRPKKRLNYRIQWGASGLFGRKKTRTGAEIIISSLSGSGLPAVKLCCRRDGSMLFSYDPNDPTMVVVFEMDANPETDSVSLPLDEAKFNGILSGADLQLFVVGDDKEFYEQPMCMEQQARKLP